MKIAAVTEDGTTIGAHFGKAPSYVVMTVEGGTVVARETRGKSLCGEQHQEGGHDDRFDAVKDCEIVLAGGMCEGCFDKLTQANVRPVLTTVTDINDAVTAYLEGRLEERPDLVEKS